MESIPSMLADPISRAATSLFELSFVGLAQLVRIKVVSAVSRVIFFIVIAI
jgi:hypothetical protein